MNNNSYFLAFCSKYGISPAYHPKSEEYLHKRICESDILISDDKCTHRMVGLSFTMDRNGTPLVTVVCSLNEMLLAKKIAFENAKTIFYDSKVSAHLFHKYYNGEKLYREDFDFIIPYFLKFLDNYFKNKR